MHTGLWGEELWEGDHLEDLGVDGRKILKWVFRGVQWVDMDWIVLVQDRESGRALVNVVMYLGFRYSEGNFLIS